MSKRAAVILSVSASLVLVATFIGWEYWPVALRFRHERALGAARTIVRRYLNDEDSLGVAACQLAVQMRRLNELTERLSWVEPAQRRRVVDPELAPAGTDPADRRLQELTLNAARATLPSSLPADVRARITQLNDSLIHARGFRTVECAA